MRSPAAVLASFLAVSIPAQTTTVTDVGLTMASGLLTVLWGQSCGPVTCTPMPGGSVGLGSTLNITHHAAMNSPFFIAIGLPGPCIPVSGFANSLLLGQPAELLAAGSVTQGSAISACRQGQARHTMQIPPTAPVPITFRLQSLGVSNSGQLAFSPAIETTLR